MNSQVSKEVSEQYKKLRALLIGARIGTDSARPVCAYPTGWRQYLRSGGCQDLRRTTCSSHAAGHEPVPTDQLARIMRRHAQMIWSLGKGQPGKQAWLRPGLGYWACTTTARSNPDGVHYDVTLASRHLFACVIAAEAPFPVVFTSHWLSMTGPTGGGIPVPRSPGP